MSHKNRGYALIFNHEHFEDWKPRPGTKIDCDKLHQTLTNLHFNVIIYKDKKRAEIRTIIKKISSKNHIENDCILIAILSHGEHDGIQASDSEYSLGSMAMHFTANECPSLAGKPKLFFIQACRGELIDRGIIRWTPQGASDYYYKLPVQADFLFAYSTVPGYVSYRDPFEGSWYIQTLCEQLNNNGTRYDLMKLLIIVNQKVATEFPNDTGITIKQMPMFNSSLTKFLTFTDNSVERNVCLT